MFVARPQPGVVPPARQCALTSLKLKSSPERDRRKYQGERSQSLTLSPELQRRHRQHHVAEREHQSPPTIRSHWPFLHTRPEPDTERERYGRMFTRSKSLSIQTYFPHCRLRVAAIARSHGCPNRVEVARLARGSPRTNGAESTTECGSARVGRPRIVTAHTDSRLTPYDRCIPCTSGCYAPPAVRGDFRPVRTPHSCAG